MINNRVASRDLCGPGSTSGIHVPTPIWTVWYSGSHNSTWNLLFTNLQLQIWSLELGIDLDPALRANGPSIPSVSISLFNCFRELHAIHPIIAKSVLQSHSNPDFQILGLVRIKLWIPKQRRFSLIPSVSSLKLKFQNAAQGAAGSLR